MVCAVTAASTLVRICVALRLPAVINAASLAPTPIWSATSPVDASLNSRPEIVAVEARGAAATMALSAPASVSFCSVISAAICVVIAPVSNVEEDAIVNQVVIAAAETAPATASMPAIASLTDTLPLVTSATSSLVAVGIER